MTEAINIPDARGLLRAYELNVLCPEPMEILLRRLDNDSRYEVYWDGRGWECNCEDKHFKGPAKRGESWCKHIRAVRSWIGTEPTEEKTMGAENGLTETRATTAVVQRPPMTQDQVALIKRTVCKGANNDELGMFLAVCQRTGLDPFAKQIHAVKRWDSDLGRDVMSIQVGIGGYQLIAERTGQMDGTEGPFWCADDGIWQEVWLEDEPPVAAKCVVHRRGHTHPYTAICRFKSYVQRKRNGSPMARWATAPAEQLGKCAEAAALRKAFPQELAGLATDALEVEDHTLPTRQAAVTPAARVEHKPATPAPAAEPTVAEFVQGIVTHEANMAGAEVCAAGELQESLCENLILGKIQSIEKGQFAQARELARSFEIEHLDLGITRELSRTGVDLQNVLADLQITELAGLPARRKVYVALRKLESAALPAAVGGQEDDNDIPF
jgi:phage recombination protein Bet